MKRIIWGLLFVGGVVNCQSKLTYEDILKYEAATEKYLGSIPIEREHHAKKKRMRLFLLFNDEKERCMLAKNCETSEELLTIYGEYMKAGKESKAATKAVEESPEFQEFKVVREEILSKL